ncbi:unnamed protein product [Microthlaspi erraticum]|uniref:Uncharacterized protein n=1 Tax=Microthlaspi erraticum TaxID=1685480 RepID=A0A6D2HNM1_9BRAS|nr:unnamed protein product [Microthlaspi erraticum]
MMSSQTLLENFDEQASSSNQPMNEEEEAAGHSSNSDERKAFEALLADANEELYEGCTSFSKLSFMLKLYHIKSICKISDKGLSMIIDLLREAFQNAKLPASLHDLKKTIQKLGLDYESIHACPNDCMLFWGEDAEREVCKVCNVSRWKGKSTEGVSEKPRKCQEEKKEDKASC